MITITPSSDTARNYDWIEIASDTESYILVSQQEFDRLLEEGNYTSAHLNSKQRCNILETA
tara:strand:+ start:887 stop:1069 length:183 start_codon:yes stop_codon:yes gene_type:complete